MAVDFAAEVAKAKSYPLQFNARERKLLESVSAFLPFRVVSAGSFTTLGGDANESITVSGAVASDIVVVSVKTAGVTPRSIVSAAAGTDAIAVVLSGDPSTDHVLHYIVVRANS